MAKRITFSAISMALTVICLYGAAFLPTGRLAALALSSVFVTICVYQYGWRYGTVVFLGASVLALLFIPNRMLTVVYILFAGHYPIIKLFIEQLDRLWLEWVLKFLYFNLMLIVMYILFKLFVVPSVDSVVVSLVLHYLAVVILALEVIFAFFDWALSHMLSYYDTFLRRIHYE